MKHFYYGTIKILMLDKVLSQNKILTRPKLQRDKPSMVLVQPDTG